MAKAWLFGRRELKASRRLGMFHIPTVASTASIVWAQRILNLSVVEVFKAI